jgi:hypothetical protein
MATQSSDATILAITKGEFEHETGQDGSSQGPMEVHPKGST